MLIDYYTALDQKDTNAYVLHKVFHLENKEDQSLYLHPFRNHRETDYQYPLQRVSWYLQYHRHC